MLNPDDTAAACCAGPACDTRASARLHLPGQDMQNTDSLSSPVCGTHRFSATHFTEIMKRLRKMQCGLSLSHPVSLGCAAERCYTGAKAVLAKALCL